MHQPIFSAVAQVDAVAACSVSHGPVSPTKQHQSNAETTLLAVAQSQLEGNVWSGSVALLEATTCEQQCELQLKTGVAALTWCGGHHKILAMACDDGDVRLAKLSPEIAFVPIETNETMTNEEENKTMGIGWGHDELITDIQVSWLEKTQVATCSWDLTCVAIDLISGGVKEEGCVTLVCVCEDRVKLWDLGTMGTTLATFSGHTDLIWSVAMNPTHAHLLCSASQDRTVQIWDARCPQDAALVVATFVPALSVDWHPRHSTVFSAGLEDGSVSTFDVRSPRTPLAQQETHRAAVHAIKYSPYHDDLLATGGDDSKAFVATGSFSFKQTADSGARELLIGEENFAPHRDYVRALEWFQLPSALPTSEDKKLDTILATGSWDKSVHKWSVADYAAPGMDELSSPSAVEATIPVAAPVLPVA